MPVKAQGVRGKDLDLDSSGRLLILLMIIEVVVYVNVDRLLLLQGHTVDAHLVLGLGDPGEDLFRSHC